VKVKRMNVRAKYFFIVSSYLLRKKIISVYNVKLYYFIANFKM
jgi:hypothetical protein